MWSQTGFPPLAPVLCAVLPRPHPDSESIIRSSYHLVRLGERRNTRLHTILHRSRSIGWSRSRVEQGRVELDGLGWDGMGWDGMVWNEMGRFATCRPSNGPNTYNITYDHHGTNLILCSPTLLLIIWLPPQSDSPFFSPRAVSSLWLTHDDEGSTNKPRTHSCTNSMEIHRIHRIQLIYGFVVLLSALLLFVNFSFSLIHSRAFSSCWVWPLSPLWLWSMHK